jgi:putative heme iron utilization protein
MATLNDEQKRALQLLARHPDGCAEAVLLAEGFSVGQLAVLVVDGFAKMHRTPTDVDGRQKNVIWMEITEEGRNAIAE